jgi:hypothetical protein
VRRDEPVHAHVSAGEKLQRAAVVVVGICGDPDLPDRIAQLVDDALGKEGSVGRDIDAELGSSMELTDQRGEPLEQERLPDTECHLEDTPIARAFEQVEQERCREPAWSTGVAIAEGALQVAGRQQPNLKHTRRCPRVLGRRGSSSQRVETVRRSNRSKPPSTMWSIQSDIGRTYRSPTGDDDGGDSKFVVDLRTRPSRLVSCGCCPLVRGEIGIRSPS